MDKSFSSVFAWILVAGLPLAVAVGLHAVLVKKRSFERAPAKQKSPEMGRITLLAFVSSLGASPVAALFLVVEAALLSVVAVLFRSRALFRPLVVLERVSRVLH